MGIVLATANAADEPSARDCTVHHSPATQPATEFLARMAGLITDALSR